MTSMTKTTAPQIKVVKAADYDVDEKNHDVLVDGEKVGQVAFGYFRSIGQGYYSAKNATMGYKTRKEAVAAVIAGK